MFVLELLLLLSCPFALWLLVRCCRDFITAWPDIRRSLRGEVIEFPRPMDESGKYITFDEGGAGEGGAVALGDGSEEAEGLGERRI